MGLFNDDLRKILTEGRQKYGMQSKPSLFSGTGGFSQVTPMPPRENNIHKRITAPYEDQPGQVIAPNNDAIGGGEDTGLDNSEMNDGIPGAQKPSLFSKLFKGQSGQVDANGMPQRDKPSIFKTVTDVALPTLFGLASGVGPIPGLMSGMASRQTGIEDKYKQDVDAYQGQQKIENDADYNKAVLGLKEDALTDDWNMNQINSDIKRDSAARPPKVSGADRKMYIELVDKFKKDPDSLTDGELDVLESLKGSFGR